MKGRCSTLNATKSGFTDSVNFKSKHKAPPSYSRAGENARSLNGRGDDEL